MFEMGMRQSGVKPFSLDVTGSNNSILEKLNHTKPLDIDENRKQEKTEPYIPEIDHGGLGIIQNPQNKVRNIVGTLGLERQDGKNDKGN